MLHLGLVQHCQGPNTPPMLHAVQLVEWVWSLLSLLLLLSLLPSLLVLILGLLFLAAGTVDKAQGSPLHLI